MEEPRGQQRGRLVDHAGLLQQVTGGPLAQARGEPLGQPVPPRQLGQRRDHPGVQVRGPAAHPPGGQGHPGQQPVPARVGEADLLLGDDAQPVVHTLCPVRRGGGHPALHLGGIRPAQPQQQPGRRPDPAEAAAAAHVHGRVQAPYEAPRIGYVRVRGGTRTGDDRRQDRPQLRDPHPPQERRTDHQHGRRTGHGLGTSGYAAPAVGRMGAVLQPAVAVRRQGYRGGRRHVHPVGQVPHQPVEIGSGGLGQRHRRRHRRARPQHHRGEDPAEEQHQRRDRAHHERHSAPGPAGQPARRPGGHQHHREGGGQQRDGQRPAAHAQHGQGAGPRGRNARFHDRTDSGHGRSHPLCPAAALLTPPL